MIRQTQQREYVSIERAVELTSLGRTTIYALMESGKLPYHKVGRRRLIAVEAINALVQAGAVPARQ